MRQGHMRRQSVEQRDCADAGEPMAKNESTNAPPNPMHTHTRPNTPMRYERAGERVTARPPIGEPGLSLPAATAE